MQNTTPLSLPPSSGRSQPSYPHAFSAKYENWLWDACKQTKTRHCTFSSNICFRIIKYYGAKTAETVADKRRMRCMNNGGAFSCCCDWTTPVQGFARAKRSRGTTPRLQARHARSSREVARASGNQNAAFPNRPARRARPSRQRGAGPPAGTAAVGSLHPALPHRPTLADGTVGAAGSGRTAPRQWAAAHRGCGAERSGGHLPPAPASRRPRHRLAACFPGPSGPGRPLLLPVSCCPSLCRGKGKSQLTVVVGACVWQEGTFSGRTVQEYPQKAGAGGAYRHLCLSVTCLNVTES